jgi:hypothetical protein
LDDSRFDGLTRALAADGSRRRFLGGIAAAALGFAGLRRVDAATCRQDGGTCTRNGQCCSGYCGEPDNRGRRRCGCAADEDCPVPNGCYISYCCDGACGLTPTVDFDNDPANCGTCGNVCQAPEGRAVHCAAGTCTVGCPAGFREEGDQCIPLLADHEPCTASAECAGGLCVCTVGECEAGICTKSNEVTQCDFTSNMQTPGGAIEAMCLTEDNYASDCSATPCAEGYGCSIRSIVCYRYP